MLNVFSGKGKEGPLKLIQIWIDVDTKLINFRLYLKLYKYKFNILPSLSSVACRIPNSANCSSGNVLYQMFFLSLLALPEW